MFDTYITVQGNVLNNPERKTTTRTNAVVATFRVASHPRRFDRTAQQWVDRDGLRIKVNCWRRLGDHVCASIRSGDPVVIYGRISTKEWKNEQGETRISYELDADAVGHDLSRGTATFTKTRTDLATTVIEDEDSENRVNGELTEPLPSEESPDEGIDDSYDDFPHRNGYASADMPDVGADTLAILRGAGLDLTQTGRGVDGGDSGGSDAGSDEGDDTDEEEMVGAVGGSGGSSGRGRRRGRAPVPA